MPYFPSDPIVSEKPRSSSPIETDMTLHLGTGEKCTTSPTRVHSKAVVRYAEVGIPVPLNKIAQNTDLRLVE